MRTIELINATGERRIMSRRGRLNGPAHQNILEALERRALRFRQHTRRAENEAEGVDETGTVPGVIPCHDAAAQDDRLSIGVKVSGRRLEAWRMISYGCTARPQAVRQRE